MNKLQQIHSAINFYFGAKTKYDIDSPFVYSFIEKVLEDDRWFYMFELLEKVRNQLLRTHQKVTITDFGAGSRVHKSNTRTISQIIKTASTAPYYAQLLFSTILHFKPKKILELGTSLGLTTMYQAMAAENSHFISLEGCPNTAGLARHNLQKFEVKNVQIRDGRFEDTLEKALTDLKTVDYVFFDGNHQKEPTISYFQKALPFAHNDTVFIFDDIHWSKGMKAAWKTIQQHPKVTLTIDLYQFGFVFFRTEQREKTHYQLIHTKLKPWRLGFQR